MIAASCGTPRTVSSYPYPGSPYPGSPYPGGTTYPYPGSPYPGSPYPESYPYPGSYPRRTQPVVVYRQPQKVYVPERRREVIVEHRNDRRYNDHDRNDRDHDRDHDSNRNHDGNHNGNRRSNSKN